MGKLARFARHIINDPAPDPTSFLNLFGALPYDIPPFLLLFSIGVYPIIMGITMWMQQKLNPAPTDPTQKMIFAWMPWVFMFMLGRFASGLVIYWCANNIITFTQQYLIMRSQGVNVDILGNITSGFKRKPAAETAVAKTAPSTPKPEDQESSESDEDDPAPTSPVKRTRKRRKGGGTK